MSKQNVLVKIREVRTKMVENAYPSIFSNRDVCVLLDTIEDLITNMEYQETPAIDFDSLEREIKSRVDSIIDSFDYENSIELELDDREIRVDMNTRDLKIELHDVIEEEIAGVRDLAVMG